MGTEQEEGEDEPDSSRSSAGSEESSEVSGGEGPREEEPEEGPQEDAPEEGKAEKSGRGTNRKGSLKTQYAKGSSTTLSHVPATAVQPSVEMNGVRVTDMNRSTYFTCDDALYTTLCENYPDAENIVITYVREDGKEVTTVFAAFCGHIHASNDHHLLCHPCEVLIKRRLCYHKTERCRYCKKNAQAAKGGRDKRAKYAKANKSKHNSSETPGGKRHEARHWLERLYFIQGMLIFVVLIDPRIENYHALEHHLQNMRDLLRHHRQGANSDWTPTPDDVVGDEADDLNRAIQQPHDTHLRLWPSFNQVQETTLDSFMRLQARNYDDKTGMSSHPVARLNMPHDIPVSFPDLPNNPIGTARRGAIHRGYQHMRFNNSINRFRVMFPRVQIPRNLLRPPRRRASSRTVATGGTGAAGPNVTTRSAASAQSAQAVDPNLPGTSTSTTHEAVSPPRRSRKRSKLPQGAGDASTSRTDSTLPPKKRKLGADQGGKEERRRMRKQQRKSPDPDDSDYESPVKEEKVEEAEIEEEEVEDEGVEEEKSEAEDLEETQSVKSEIKPEITMREILGESLGESLDTNISDTINQMAAVNLSLHVPDRVSPVMLQSMGSSASEILNDIGLPIDAILAEEVTNPEDTASGGSSRAEIAEVVFETSKPTIVICTRKGRATGEDHSYCSTERPRTVIKEERTEEGGTVTPFATRPPTPEPLAEVGEDAEESVFTPAEEARAIIPVSLQGMIDRLGQEEGPIASSTPNRERTGTTTQRESGSSVTPGQETAITEIIDEMKVHREQSPDAATSSDAGASTSQTVTPRGQQIEKEEAATTFMTPPSIRRTSTSSTTGSRKRKTPMRTATTTPARDVSATRRSPVCAVSPSTSAGITPRSRRSAPILTYASPLDEVRALEAVKTVTTSTTKTPPTTATLSTVKTTTTAVSSSTDPVIVSITPVIVSAPSAATSAPPATTSTTPSAARPTVTQMSRFNLQLPRTITSVSDTLSSAEFGRMIQEQVRLVQEADANVRPELLQHLSQLGCVAQIKLFLRKPEPDEEPVAAGAVACRLTQLGPRAAVVAIMGTVLRMLTPNTDVQPTLEGVAHEMGYTADYLCELQEERRQLREALEGAVGTNTTSFNEWYNVSGRPEYRGLMNMLNRVADADAQSFTEELEPLLTCILRIVQQFYRQVEHPHVQTLLAMSAGIQLMPSNDWLRITQNLSACLHGATGRIGCLQEPADSDEAFKDFTPPFSGSTVLESQALQLVRTAETVRVAVRTREAEANEREAALRALSADDSAAEALDSLGNAEAAHDKLSEELKVVKEDKDKLQQAFNDVARKYNELKNESAKEIAGLSASSSEQTNEIARLKAELKDAKTAVDAQVIKTLQQRLNQTRREKETAEQEVRHANQIIDGLRPELERTRTELETVRQRADSEKEKLEGELKKANNALGDAQKHKEEYLETAVEYRKSIDKIQAEARKHQEAKEKAEGEQARLQRELDTAKEQFRNVEANRAKLERDQKRLRTERDEARKKRDDSEKDVKREREAKERSEHQAMDLRTQNTELVRQLRDKEELLQEKRDLVQAGCNIIRNLQIDVDSVRAYVGMSQFQRPPLPPRYVAPTVTTVLAELDAYVVQMNNTGSSESTANPAPSTMGPPQPPARSRHTYRNPNIPPIPPRPQPRTPQQPPGMNFGLPSTTVSTNPWGIDPEIYTYVQQAQLMPEDKSLQEWFYNPPSSTATY